MFILFCNMTPVANRLIFYRFLGILVIHFYLNVFYRFSLGPEFTEGGEG